MSIDVKLSTLLTLIAACSFIQKTDGQDASNEALLANKFTDSEVIGVDESVIILTAKDASLVGDQMKYDEEQNTIIGWQALSDQAVWHFHAKSDGKYDVQATWSLANSAAAFEGNRYEIELNGIEIGKQLAPKVEGYVDPGGGRATTTGSWNQFKEFLLGQISLPTGVHEIAFHPAAKLNGEWLRLRSLRLVPANPDGEYVVPPFEVADGFTVELAAAPTLVKYPMMACLDERGRLFVAESSGSNESGAELQLHPPHQILMLEDTDGDGAFDKRTVFADGLTIPNGVLWHDDSLYVCSAPYLWKFQDTDGDGVADSKSRLPVTFNCNGNHSGMHGPSMGPDGRLYWCGGVHGWRFDDNLPFSFDGPWTSRTPGAFAIWPDGSMPEVVGHGGRANPVEIAFTENGDALGTVAVYDLDEGRHDALLHWTDGSMFNLTPGREIGLKIAGDILTPLSRRGHVAPSGVSVYRSSNFGEEYVGNVFIAEFNTHSVQRLVLNQAGSTFSSTEQVMLSSSSPYTHFTDVFEDADGSLLVVDTGGWFVRACPTSRIAKPEIRGAIFRIRKETGDAPSDPRGLQLDWLSPTDSKLASRLGDNRFVVRDRAMVALVKRGDSAVSQLDQVLLKSSNPMARRQAVWTLCRMRTATANASLRRAMEDSDLDVRLSASHSLATLRDAKSVDLFVNQLASPQAAERRLAATGLGRIGDPKVVPHLLEAFSNSTDPFLEHALILSLIRIGDQAGTQIGLTSTNPNIRRAALVALDQMDDGKLTRDQVIPLINSNDVKLQQKALEVIAKHQSWSSDIDTLLRTWLDDSAHWDSHKSLVRSTLSAFAWDQKVQKLVAELLHADVVNVETKLMLLEVMASCELEAWPEIWDRSLKALLRSNDEPVVREAISTIAQKNLAGFNADIKNICEDNNYSTAVRIAGLGTLAKQNGVLTDQAVDLLITHVHSNAPPLERLQAASALSVAKLSVDQSDRLASLIAKAGPLELPVLLSGFHSRKESSIGRKLILSLEESAYADSLTASQVEKAFESFPQDVREAAQKSLDGLQPTAAEQAERLLEMEASLSDGDAVAGRAVFFGEKASCSACHRVDRQGGEIGPNLSAIARIRSTRDLLESVLYPSATLARDYETFHVLTTSGGLVTGTIQRETGDAVYLRTADRAEVRVEHESIEEMSRSNVSIMPQGLENTISHDELNHLMTFLKTLK